MWKSDFLICYSQPAPCVGDVQIAVGALYHSRIRVLVYGAVLQGNEIPEMLSVVADGHTERSARPFLLTWDGGEIVVDKDMTAVAKSDGVSAALIVRNVGKGNLRPCVATVVTV